MKHTLSILKEWLTDTSNLLGGFLMSLFGFLLPIKNLVLFITVLFILDVAVGYWKAHKLSKEKFQAKIVWEKTMPRWLFSVIILTLLFSWDKVHHQDYINTYYVGGYFLSGVIISSIVDNALKITNWRPFGTLRNIINGNIQKNTGHKVEENE